LSLNNIKSELRAYSDPKRKAFSPSFFKTGKGEYGEGDKFIGVTAPNIRKIAKKYNDIDEKDIQKLLYSSWHEERFCAWVIVIDRYEKSGNKSYWYNFALNNISQLNNWDLVDMIAPRIVGDYLIDKPQKQFLTWSNNSSLWIRRIAMIATFPKIKQNEFSLTLKLSKKYLTDSEDLIHKATGWMLREIGKRDEEQLLKFMDDNHKDMPRIMVSYALEKISKEKKKRYRLNR
tara:strand:- start:5 stop:700 length:696 start_codon:yes stop_codon:yes gene_type:complete